MQDVFRLESPGGGGYGVCDGTSNDDDENHAPHKRRRCRVDHGQQVIEHGSVHAYRMAQESA